MLASWAALVKRKCYEAPVALAAGGMVFVAAFLMGLLWSLLTFGSVNPSKVAFEVMKTLFRQTLVLLLVLVASVIYAVLFLSRY